MLDMRKWSPTHMLSSLLLDIQKKMVPHFKKMVPHFYATSSFTLSKKKIVPHSYATS